MLTLLISRLSKTYRNGTVALRDVTLEIRQGVFGILGPNGAGKSTLMRILATLQEPSGGSATLDGIDLLAQKHEARKLLGYLPQDFGFDPRETALSLLTLFAKLKGIDAKEAGDDAVARLLERVNLWDVRTRRLGEFSGGMRQRLGIAIALLGDPRLVIVDEPTSGLDPAERRRFHNLLAEVAERAVVILSTHIVEDVRDLCAQMAVIDRGRIILSGNPRDLARELGGFVWRTTAARADLPAIRAAHRVLDERLSGGEVSVRVYSAGQPGSSFEPAEATIEDVYFHRLGMTA